MGFNLFNKQIAGVELKVSPGGGYNFHWVITAKVKGEIKILSRGQASSLDELIAVFPEDMGIAFTVHGSGILLRKTPVQGDKPVEKILPGSNPDDFSVHQYLISSTENWAALIRTDLIFSLIQTFKKKKGYLLTLDASPVVLCSFTDLFDNISEEKILLPPYNLTIRENTITEISHNEPSESDSKMRFAGELMETADIIPYAAALRYWSDEGTTAPVIEAGANEYRAKLLFRKAGAIFLALAFIVLLMNFLLYSKYNSEYTKLSGSVTISKQELLLADSLRTLLSNKRAYLERNGLLQRSCYAYFADRLALSLPEKIQLTRLAFNPVLDKLKDGDLPVFDHGRVVITGHADFSTTLNDWMKIIRKEIWINDVELVRYYKDNTGNGFFELEILLINE